MIELNHLYNKDTSHLYDQVIFWKEYTAVGLNRKEFHTCGFQLIRSYGEYPEKIGNRYRVVINLFNKRVEVWAPIFRESHTQEDPERKDHHEYWNWKSPNIVEDLFKKPTKEE